jgi:tetratricopeptide (TPR) repeat protein
MLRLTILGLLVQFVLVPRLQAEPSDAHPRQRVEALIARGALLERRGDASSAIAYYRDAIAAAPRDARGYLALGHLYLDLDEAGRALEVFEAGTRAQGADEALWLGLYEAQSRAGQSSRALVTLRELLAFRADSVRALAELSRRGAESGHWIEALAATRALLAAQPSEAHATEEFRALELRARALELLLGGDERVRAGQCPASSAVLSALRRCRSAPSGVQANPGSRP